MILRNRWKPTSKNVGKAFANFAKVLCKATEDSVDKEDKELFFVVLFLHS